MRSFNGSSKDACHRWDTHSQFMQIEERIAWKKLGLRWLKTKQPGYTVVDNQKKLIKPI